MTSQTPAGEVAKGTTQGVVYIAWGDRFVAEAISSARSLQKRCNFPTVLMTSAEYAGPSDVFTSVVEVPLGKSYKDKIFMGQSPFEKTLFLDTDTIILEDISEIFNLLDRFDFVFQAADGGLHYAIADMPMHAFPEPSAGVLAWRRNVKTERFFKLWAEEYDVQQRLHGEGAWDQRSLRAALWKSDVSVAALQGTWQLYAWIATPLLGPVRILHGRGQQMQALAKNANRSLGYRIYIPRIGMLNFHGQRPEEYAKLALYALAIALRRSFRLVLARLGLWKLPSTQRPM